MLLNLENGRVIETSHIVAAVDIKHLPKEYLPRLQTKGLVMNATRKSEKPVTAILFANGTVMLIEHRASTIYYRGSEA